MRVAITGGGTGGHVYPALEVARLASERGAELFYLGSNRGQEGEACRARGILFEGLPSEPLYSLSTPRGWQAAARLLKCVGMAKRALRAAKPAAVFSTGGYSAAPVMAAARSLGIPFAIHESNSVPGRSNRMFANAAASVTCSFHATLKHLPSAIRTGQPIRAELREASRVETREAASNKRRSHPQSRVLVLGGSQGSAFLNERMPEAALLVSSEIEFIHATGRAHFDQMKGSSQVGSNYELRPYLGTEEIAKEFTMATVAVARSGGTVAEFALFGLPSVLVPLPTSADDHQLENAKEFVAFGGARLVPQSQATPQALASAIESWLVDPDERKRAGEALRAWDVPDATNRIVDLLFALCGHEDGRIGETLGR